MSLEDGYVRSKGNLGVSKSLKHGECLFLGKMDR